MAERGRPPKLNVSWFPHYCTPKKTLYILEQNFGNDGYAFWFKLLEQLGLATGHYIDIRSNGAGEFLYAYTRVDEEKATIILKMLAKLHAIDEEMWEHRVIWCQNLVDHLDMMYKRRATEPPQRPEHLLNDNNK